MNRKDFPYFTSFSSEIQCIVSTETDKFLSIASLNNLKFLIPQNFVNNSSVDLLPIAFNAAVANRCNKNGDCIDTSIALNICGNFVSRPVDLEHKKTNIIGHIINAGFTSFGTDKELTLEDATKLTDPFNIALAAYIYSYTYDDLSEIIEESADPSSLRYKAVSASWELGFKNYKIVKGSKNLSEATVITDPDESKKLEPLLQANGGKGKDSNGNYIYRLIEGEVYPLGIGLTATPAADVKGVFVPGISNMESESSSEIAAVENNLKINEEIISNSELLDVNKLDMKKLSTIEDIKGLTDETLKECSASNVNNVVADALAKISEEVMTERKAKEDALSNASKLSKDVSDVKAELEKIQAAAALKESQDTFNARMTSIDTEYTLTDAHRKIVAKQIKDLDEAGFTVWATDFEVLAKNDKKVKADDDSEAKAKKVKEDKDKADMESKAAKDKEDKEKADKDAKDKDSKKDKEAKASTAREFLDKIEISKASATIPNSQSSTESLRDKAKVAFNKDTVKFTSRR